jgi:hypothetical protein
MTSRGLVARHDLQRLMNAMLVAGLKVGAHDNIPERDGRLHKHNAGRSGPAELSQDLGQEVQEEAWHGEAFDVWSGRIGGHALILERLDNAAAKIWFSKASSKDKPQDSRNRIRLKRAPLLR